jgi:hypothetical protein
MRLVPGFYCSICPDELFSVYIMCIFADGMSKGSSDNSILQSILQCIVDNETAKAKGSQVFNFSHVGDMAKKWPV